MIPYGRQEITRQDLEAVASVLQSEFLTTGPAVRRFEEAVTKQVGARYGVAVNSGTSALHVACLALGLGPSEILWTVPNTFVASANCGRYCGADVDFVDIDPLSWDMSVPRLTEKLEEAKRLGRLPKVVVPVHFSGQPTDQESIWTLAQKYGFRVLEDASHSIGAARNGEPVGSCRWSDITVFSFHPVKIVTSGEGGVSVTNDRELMEKMVLYRGHGITRDPRHFRSDSHSKEAKPLEPGGWYYEQQALGYNYRMTDIHAALGTSQLERLKEYVERRNALARRYDTMLDGLPLQRPHVRAENLSSFHLYVVRLEIDGLGKSHRQVYDQLRDSGIGVNLHYIPVHLQPYYRDLGFEWGLFPEAEGHGRSAITLPMYPTLSEKEQDRVVSTLCDVLTHR